MATQTISPIDPSAKSAVVFTLARQRAIKAVKQQVLASRAKWSELSCRTVNELASVYLAANRQVLIEQAIETISKSPVLRKFYEREQGRRAKLSNNAQATEPSNSTTSTVQKSGAK